MRQIFANRFEIFRDDKFCLYSHFRAKISIVTAKPLEVVPDFKKAISRTPLDPEG